MTLPAIRHSFRALPGLLFLLAAGCNTTPQPKIVDTSSFSPTAKEEGAFDDDQHPTTPIEAMVISAGKDPAKLAVIERDLLVMMREPGATPAVVQEAAQHLGYILLAGSQEMAPTTRTDLALMLRDPAKIDFARLALDRVPGPAVDKLFLETLPGATGRSRLALIDSVGARGIAAAVPLLASGLREEDAAIATATAQALGRIGGQAALAALESARTPLDPAVLNARLAAAAKVNPITAARIAGEVYRNAAAPLAQRAAALRLLIDSDPAAAAEEIFSALSGTQPAFQKASIAAVSVPEVPIPAAELATRLPSYATDVQVALIAALATRGHVGALPGLLTAVESPHAEVRIAAIDALGRLPGNTEVARKLAALAAGKGDEAKAAFASLARLNGLGVESFIRTGAEGSSPSQAVFIQLLAARNETEAIPFLLDLRESPNEAVRLEALDALRAIASANEQPAIIAWALGTQSRNEQTRAIRALITIILRDGATATRANTVIAAIKSGNANARLALLPILSRVAGEQALAAAVQLARESDEAVAKAATDELARWPDATVLPALVDLTASTRNEGIRHAAAQGSAKFLSARANATPEQRSLYTRQLLALPQDAPARIALLNVLSLCADADALAAARGFVADPATSAAAQDAIDAITSNLAGAPAFTASEAADKTSLLTDGRRNSYWAIPNAPGGWLRADLHNARPVRKITLDQGRREWDWPDKLEVCVSDNPDQPGAPRAQVEGEREQTVVTLPAGTRGRYVWLRQQGTRPSNAWAIAEFILE
ncbi:MAG TPA: HEAT repeat domain-containing protein [Lacunisphaera sp.]|nr:HEAT repeat domain-containing protein [Lacunisphaera sp.]